MEENQEQYSMTPPPPASDGSGLSGPAAQAAASTPGWYPAPGGQRYWDGAQWTDHVAPTAGVAVPQTGVNLSNVDDKQMAMFAHLGQLLGFVTGIGGFVVPLVIMLTKGKESPFVRAAAVESLNFWITGLIAAVISVVLMLLFIGFLLLPLVGLVWLGLPIYAGIKANEGIDYKYPFNLRMIT